MFTSMLLMALPVAVIATGDPLIDTPALQSAINQALVSGKPLVMDATVKPFAITSTLTVAPQSGQKYTKIDIDGEMKAGFGFTIDYTGNGPAIKTIGLKYSKFTNLRIKTHKDGAVGLWISTQTDVTSTSANIFERVYINTDGGAKAGFWVGPGNVVKGHDVSLQSFIRCGVSGNSSCGDGFHFFGDNMADMRLDGCLVDHILGSAFRFEPNPGYSDWTRGDGSVITACDAAYCTNWLKASGGTLLTIIGGHGEHVAGACFYAKPNGPVPNGKNGYILVQNFDFHVSTIPVRSVNESKGSLSIIGN